MAKITRKIAREWLADVPEDKVFWCSDGRVMKNLTELEKALLEMSDETFRYHANESKNDFSNWIQDVIGDVQLADDLRRNATRPEAAESIATRIAWLKTRK
jgi:hypothetical protein